MEHVAILAKKRKLLGKIHSGEKTIESRWYKYKKTPYNNIQKNDIIYFKDSGEMVSTKAIVGKVLFFDNLNREKIQDILKVYGKQICIPLSYAPKLEEKKYCTLIFIKNIELIPPFAIDKSGYGNMAAWITMESVNGFLCI